MNTTVISSGTNYKVIVYTGNHTLIADEPIDKGGKDLGPNPFEYLLSSLGTCTIITLQMYIQRKHWDIGQISVTLDLIQHENGNKIERSISFGNIVSEEQHLRLLQIANACPVHKILSNPITINTILNN